MNVMKRAHELAKQGVSRFGGKHAEYFSEALRIAYKEQKALVTVEPVKNSFITLIFITLMFLVISFTSAESVASIKPINSDIPIDFIDIKNSFNNFLLQIRSKI